jgi:hypothetical protein
VPIKLVFEVPNRLPLDGCIPAQNAPFDFSIVVVAPSKVLKVTAPDESRHNMWLTALQYLVDSTKKVDDKAWPDVLAARLALLTSQVEDMFKELPTPQEDQDQEQETEVRIYDKPLPPSPPTSEGPAIMRAPSVPRFPPPQHGRQVSTGLSTTADSDAFAPSGPGSIKSQRAEALSIRSQQAEPYTPSDEKRPSESRHGGIRKKEDDADTDVDQMDALLDRMSSPGM